MQKAWFSPLDKHRKTTQPLTALCVCNPVSAVLRAAQQDLIPTAEKIPMKSDDDEDDDDGADGLI